MSKVYVVEGDGVVWVRSLMAEDVRDLVRFGTVVAVLRRSPAGIQYADVDLITHELEWKTAELQEE